jgi:hypothetical protein
MRLRAGALGQLINHRLPTLKLQRMQRRGERTVRQYGPAQTPYARVLAAAEVSAEAKAGLRASASFVSKVGVNRVTPILAQRASRPPRAG